MSKTNTVKLFGQFMNMKGYYKTIQEAIDNNLQLEEAGIYVYVTGAETVGDGKHRSYVTATGTADTAQGEVQLRDNFKLVPIKNGYPYYLQEQIDELKENSGANELDLPLNIKNGDTNVGIVSYTANKGENEFSFNLLDATYKFLLTDGNNSEANIETRKFNLNVSSSRTDYKDGGFFEVGYNLSQMQMDKIRFFTNTYNSNEAIIMKKGEGIEILSSNLTSAIQNISGDDKDLISVINKLQTKLNDLWTITIEE